MLYSLQLTKSKETWQGKQIWVLADCMALVYFFCCSIWAPMAVDVYRTWYTTLDFLGNVLCICMVRKYDMHMLHS